MYTNKVVHKLRVYT